MQTNEANIEVDLSGVQNVLTAKEEKALLAYFKKYVPKKLKENPKPEVKAPAVDKDKI